MTKNYKHIILFIWFNLLWASPAMASFEDSKITNEEVLVTPASASVTLVPS